MILDEAWALSPSVALRPEPFGALAYHFGNRKLTFLKRPELLTVVRALGEHPDVQVRARRARRPRRPAPGLRRRRSRDWPAPT